MFKKKPAILNQDSDTMCFNHAELGEFNLIQHESSSKTALAEIERLIKDNDGRDAKTIVVDYLLDKVMPKHFKFFICEDLLHALWVYGDGLYCERVILDPDSEFLTMYNLLLGRYSPFPLKDDVAFNKLNATKMNCKLNKVFAAVFKRRQGSVFQGCVIYDLGDAKVAEITEEGVKVVPNTFTQVIFKSVNQHYEQPYPDFENANHELLFRYINLHGEEQQLLLTAALCYTIAGEEGYPVLFFTGDAGSGKTEGCRFCTSLIDNGADTIRRLTRKEEDFKLGCFNRHVVAYDNVTSLTAVLQELMCICVTGGSVATRMLYENTKEQVIRLNNPLFLTSINMPELQADLVDRRRLSS